MKKIIFLLLITVFSFAGLLADDYGYSYITSANEGGPTYNWIEPDTTNAILGFGDTTTSDSLSIGFDFPFYGETHNVLYVSSDGMISFDGGYITYNNTTIPNSTTPNNYIALFWDDLHGGYEWANSHVYYENQTIDGQNAFILSYISYPEFGGSQAPNDCFQAQAILFENGNIRFQYDYFGVDFDVVGATIGLENSDGTDGTLYEYNENLVSDDFAIDFNYPVSYDTDMQMLSISADSNIIAGQAVDFAVAVKNRGTNTVDAYSVELALSDGTVLSTTDFTTSLEADASTTETIQYTFSEDTVGTQQITAKVILAGDMTEINNVATTSIFVNSQWNLAANSIEGNQMVYVNDMNSYTIEVENHGADQDTYTVQIIDAMDNILAETIVNETIPASETVEIDLGFTATTIGNLELRGKVILDNDLISENNITEAISLTVIETNTDGIQVGNGTDLNYVPWNAYYRNSLSQVIYYQEELGGQAGTIQGITYFYSATDTMNERSFEMWIAEVDSTNLVNGWVPADEFTQVYNNTISLLQGDHELYIDFDQDFTYSGSSNLCVMVRRGDRAYLSNRKFYTEASPEYPNRGLKYQNDSVETGFPDIEAYPELSSYSVSNISYVPNTLFHYAETLEFGNVTGVVSDVDGPVAGANVSFSGSRNIATTDNNGTYYFHNVATGTYTISTEKFGYIDVDTENVVVTNGNTTTQNITIAEVANVIVSGKIVGSDALETGLANATITLSGYASYTATTDANGDFSINDVYSDRDYDYEVTVDNYQTKTGTVTIAGTDTTLDDIIVDEIAYQSGAITAVQADDFSSVSISWDVAAAPALRNNKDQIGNGGRKIIYNNNRTTPTFPKTNARNSRSLQGYKVYRLADGDEEIELNWTEISTGIITENTFEYTEWSTIPEGFYNFAVKAVYSNDVLSDAVISDWVGKDKYTSATLVLTMADGTSVDGATATFTGLTEDPDGNTYNYTGEVNAEGNIVIPMIWKGMYNIVVSKENYGSIIQENVDITTETTINVSLAEIMNPVVGLEATVTGDVVELIWNTPGTSTGYDFEANNGGFVSNDTEGWQHGTPADSIGTHSGINVWGTVLDTTYINNADWTLDTPAMPIAGGSVLAFWHHIHAEGSSTSAFDGGNVKISVDNGTTWELLTPIEGYTHTGINGLDEEEGFSGYVAGWIESTFDLNNYAGQTAMIRFHFGSDISIMKAGWFIDDVEIRPARFVTAEERIVNNNSKSKEIISRSREFESYKVMRGTDVLAAAQTDTTYTDSNVASGTYDYSVIAHYTYGDSDPATVSVNVYPINISGTISANDAAALANATVHISNDNFDFTATTGTDGTYSIDNAQGNETYNVEVTHPNYNDYTGTITVTDENYTFDQTLNETTNAPQTVTATKNAMCSEVTITWTTPTRNRELSNSLKTKSATMNSRSLTGYQVYRFLDGQEDNQVNWVTIVDNTTEQSFVEVLPSDINPGSYKYAVKAIYSGDIMSEPTISDVIELTQPLLPVVNLQYTIEAGEVTITWDAPAGTSGISGYKVYLNDNFLNLVGVATYTFSGLNEGVNYNAGVSVMYADVNESPMEVVNFTGEDHTVPAINSLVGNYPNPFNPTTTIKFSLKENSNVSLEIFNILGQKVKTLVNNEELNSGQHNIIWNGQSDSNQNVSSGVYFYRMKSGKYTSTKKMILMK